MHKTEEISMLCVGEVNAGKSCFLENYTGTKEDESDYKIYLKKTAKHVVYLHELSAQTDVYLKYPYGGVIFFVSMLRYHNTAQKILRWMDLISQHNGTNIFQIPFVIIALVPPTFIGRALTSEKFKLESQLKNLIDPTQLLYSEKIPNVATIDKLASFYESIQQNNALGIVESMWAKWELYGVNGIVNDIFRKSTKTVLKTAHLTSNIWQKYKQA